MQTLFHAYLFIISGAQAATGHALLVMFLGWVAHRGPQPRCRCIYSFAAKDKLNLPGFRAPERSLFMYTPSLLVLIQVTRRGRKG